MSADVVALLVVVALTAVAAWWLRSRQGRVSAGGGDAFARAALGAPPGVTLLVEFTAPGCAPCRQTEAVLSASAAQRPGIALVTADVGAHLELARAHGILRAPTTLVVTPDDRVLHRISGVPDPTDLDRLLDDAGARAA